ncbi:MAG: NTP transferase domain-containing protein [Parcubacteria group bacterium]|jgi:NDP-sugar pyrophosphorylase family protein
MNFEIKNTAEVPKDVETEKKKLFAQTTVYINAGGRGTRLESIFPKGPSGVTKALIDFNGKPMVKNHTDLLSELGFKNIIVGAGDHLDIKEYYAGQENERLRVANTETQEDTGGDLIKAIRETENNGKNVLVENVDTVLYVKNLVDLLAQHEKSDATATIVLTTKKGVPNEEAFFVDKNGRVIFSREARQEHALVEPEQWTGFKASSTGTVIFKTDFLRSYDWQPGQEPLSAYRDLIPELIKRGELFAYNNENNLFTDTGTPEKYHQIKRHEKKLFGALEKKYLDQDKK